MLKDQGDHPFLITFSSSPRTTGRTFQLNPAFIGISIYLQDWKFRLQIQLSYPFQSLLTPGNTIQLVQAFLFNNKNYQV